MAFESLNERQYTDQEIFQYIVNNNVKIRNLCSVIFEELKKMVKSNAKDEKALIEDIKRADDEYALGILRCYLAAKKGKTTPRMVLEFKDFEITKEIKELNKLERANYYIYYEYYDFYKEFTTYYHLRQAIESYEKLSRRLLNFDVNNLNGATLGYEYVKELLSNWNSRKITDFLNGITTTVNHFNQDEDIKHPKDLENYYSPVCFDVDYSITKSVVDEDLVLRRMDYSYILSGFKEELRNLLGMRADEYRKERINRMKLMAGEREFFEVDFRKFIQNLKSRTESTKKPKGRQGKKGK